MATIPVTDNSKTFQIQRFLGINESSDGDTQLQYGEASEMTNWQVTPQYHLRVRPGVKTLRKFTGPVRGLWSGWVAGSERMLCAADGGIWDLTDGAERRIGDEWDDATTFFGFNDKVYILNGKEYLVWDGVGYVDVVEGYVPCVVTAAAPSGGGTALQNINRLTGKRRIRFSADGTSTVFHLPEKNLLSVDWVMVGTARTTAFTADKALGTVTFTAAPAAGSSNVEIQYAVYNTLRAQVEAMRWWETFNGATDTRVFLYGDGSAKALYCGVTEQGVASAEYFPDLYEISVGDANTPITAMIKHYDRLLTFKPDGAFATEYSSVTLEDGTVTAGFYTVPLNREVGNEAPGQVRLVYNYPRSFYANGVYDWRMTSSTVRDERNAKLVSERVQETMREADQSKIYAFDDDSNQEYYIFLNDSDGTALVHRYIGDVWYKYTNLHVLCACRLGTDVFLGMADGKVASLSFTVRNDDGVPISALWASGNMDFKADYQRKHSSTVWVSLKPASNAAVTVTARSDRKSEYAEKDITSNIATFANASFSNWSFVTNRNPKMTRIKLKVKKFVYYKLIIKSESASSDSTVLGVDIRVRYTGYVK